MKASAGQIVLYDYELSAGCYKVRLLLALLGADYARRTIDFYPGFQHKSPEFLELNSLGQVPVLVDGDLVLRDAQAIVLYLARSYDVTGRWLPSDTRNFGLTMSWMFFAASELAPATSARLHDMLGFPADAVAVKRAARNAFRVMDDHMTLREFDGASWFVGEHATLADIVVFPAIALSRDFGIDHDAFPALRRWIRRVRSLDGFVAMPGIPDYY